MKNKPSIALIILAMVIILSASFWISKDAHSASGEQVSNYIESITRSDINLKSVFYLDGCQLKIDDLANDTINNLDLKEVSFIYKGKGNEYHPYIFETRCRTGVSCILRQLTSSHSNYGSSWSLNLGEMRHTVSGAGIGKDIVKVLNYSASLCRGVNEGAGVVEEIINSHVPANVNQNLYAKVSSIGLSLNATEQREIKNFFELGADVNYRPEGSPSMIHLSMLNYDLSALLLENGADVNDRSSRGGNTVMHRLAFSSADAHSLKMLQLYLRYQANMALTNDDNVSVADLFKLQKNWRLLGSIPSKSSNALAGANDLCNQAVYMAGGDGGFAIGYCGSSSESSEYWQCIINAISSSGKRGSSNDHVSSVIGFASGFGSCY